MPTTVAAERSAQLAADVAALNAEMEQMRSLSRGKLSEGVPPQPAPTAAEPDLASQGFAAVEKLDATIEAAPRELARRSHRQSRVRVRNYWRPIKSIKKVVEKV